MSKTQIKINKVLGLQKHKTKEYSKTKTKQTKEPKPKRLASKKPNPKQRIRFAKFFSISFRAFLPERTLSCWICFYPN
jgi:hypothetical protein